MDKTFDNIHQFKEWLKPLQKEYQEVGITVSSEKDDDGNKVARIVIGSKAYNANVVNTVKKGILKTLSNYGVEEYVVVDQNKTNCLILVPQDRDVESLVFDMSCYYVPKKKNKVDFSGFDDLKSFLKKNKIEFDVEDLEKDGIRVTIYKQPKSSIYNELNFSWNKKGKFIDMYQP